MMSFYRVIFKNRLYITVLSSAPTILLRYMSIDTHKDMISMPTVLSNFYCLVFPGIFRFHFVPKMNWQLF